MNARTFAVFGLLATTALGSGCTRQISRGLNDAGQVETPVFANPRFLRAEGGTYPAPDDLVRSGPGMTKTQLMELLGPPHFREGFAAREWDYLFLFRTPQGDRGCRYKVVFDAAYRAQTLLWQPASCSDWVAAAAGSARGGAADSSTRPTPAAPKPKSASAATSLK